MMRRLIFCLLSCKGLIYFAISKKGEKPIDGITDTNPEGLTGMPIVKCDCVTLTLTFVKILILIVGILLHSHK